jgi:ribosomal protein L30/L7E
MNGTDENEVGMGLWTVRKTLATLGLVRLTEKLVAEELSKN